MLSAVRVAQHVLHPPAAIQKWFPIQFILQCSPLFCGKHLLLTSGRETRFIIWLSICLHVAATCFSSTLSFIHPSSDPTIYLSYFINYLFMQSLIHQSIHLFFRCLNHPSITFPITCPSWWTLSIQPLNHPIYPSSDPLTYPIIQLNALILFYNFYSHPIHS